VVVEYLKALGEPNYIEGMLDRRRGPVRSGDRGRRAAWRVAMERTRSDDEAVAIGAAHRRASISLVQRQPAHRLPAAPRA
jgi:S-DNA-T family DNA segregation ATPase FtsK/SpoIIIE